MEESKSMSEGSSLDVSPDLMLFVFGVIQFSECFRIYFLFGCLSFRREIFLPPRTFMKEHGNATNHDSRVNMKTYLSFVAHNELEVNTAREMTRERAGAKDVCDVGTFLMMICVWDGSSFAEMDALSKKEKLTFLALVFTSPHSRIELSLLFTLITDRYKIVLHSKLNSACREGIRKWRRRKGKNNPRLYINLQASFSFSSVSMRWICEGNPKKGERRSLATKWEADDEST